MTHPPRSIPVTVVIPTRDEADRLPRCLAALDWAAEVIVADAGSRDGSTHVARAAGAIVLDCRGLTIGAQRNRAIARASQPWILAVDADEVASPHLADAIAAVIAEPAFDAYRVAFRNRYLGREVTRGSWALEHRVRLFRATLRYSERSVHEGVAHDGPTGNVVGGFLHHDSYRDLGHQLAKVLRYADWGAQDLRRRGRRAGLVTDLVVRPGWRFVRRYVIEGWWREGRRGLVFSAVDAWSGFAKYASLWYLEEADALRTAAAVRLSEAPEVAVAIEELPAAAS
ncbi:MAG: glycosyltransferase family 2 protein [Gemmatimonadota bacterium]|nr:glycosyltransferase family 2 protein [Gemmatimonadota bacterium]